MNQLYLECLSGMSGDMFVASLIDLGANQDTLEKALRTIPIEGYQIKVSRVKKAGLDVCDFDVILDEKYENHDHDMDFLKGEQKHHHCHEEHHHEEQHHNEEHHHEHHHHEHRGLQEVIEIIDGSEITEHAKELAIKIFTILGEAEAKAHGTTLQEVHFHEVGAIDSIVDIIAAAVCFDDLKIQEVIVPVLYEGTGTVHCAHGELPIPVPAVSHILADHQLPMQIIQQKGELITPTGAAIVAALVTSFQLPHQFTIKAIGVGAGKRAYEKPSMVRAMLITEHNKEVEKDFIIKLESNIDDCTGETLGYVCERLMEAEARDVSFTPLYMKKNRPAYEIHVLCEEEQVDKMEELLFTETTTIGIRKCKMERSILDRRSEMLMTELGEISCKVCTYKNYQKVIPEYESIAALAQKTGKPFIELYHMAEREIYGKYRSIS